MEKQRPIKENNNMLGKIVNILVIITIFFGLGYWCGKNNYTYQTAIDFLFSKKQGSSKIEKPKTDEGFSEKFTFHKSLKDSNEILLPSEKLNEDKKENRKEGKPMLKQFTLQLASYKKESFAKEYVKKLNTVGLQPYIKRYDLKKEGVWYRILWGEFETKEAAIEYANQNLKPLNIYFLAVEKW